MNRRTFLIYTGAFIVMAFLTFGSYLFVGKSLVQNSDAIHQHVNALMYLGEWLRGIVRGLLEGQGLIIPLWDFSIGYGSDILTTMHYYAFGDPLNLLSAFVPASRTEYLYGALVFARLFLAGLAFMFYCQKMGFSQSSLVISAITYAFCGWAVYSPGHHAYFLNPMLYLPLMLIGFERIFRKEGPGVFMAATCLAAISNFYFFYMLVFAVAFYALARFFSQNRPYRLKDFLQLFFKTLGAGVVGTLMAAIIFIPVVYLFLDSDRSHVTLLQDPLYAPIYYLQLVPSFLNSFFKGNWTAIGFAPVTLFALALLFVTKGSRALKVSFIILTIFMLIPRIGSALNGFSYATNRWVWAYAFLASVIVAKQWPIIAQRKVSRQDARRSLIVIALFGVVLLAIMLPLSQLAFPGKTGEGLANARWSAFISYGLVLAFAVMVYACSSGTQKPSSAASRPYQAALVLITVAGIAFSGFSTIYLSGHISEHVKIGRVYSEIKKNPSRDIAAIQKTDDAFSRYESSRAKPYNTSTITRANSVQYYWSLGASGISYYYEDLGLSERHTAYYYNSLERRAPLYALACVKYYVGAKGTEPYGFEQADEELPHAKKNLVLFENKNALPLGYTYSSFIADEDYQSLSMLQRQEAMLHGAVVPQASVATVEELCPEAQWTPNDRALDTTVTCEGASAIEQNGALRIDAADGATLILSFPKTPNAEYYVSLKNLQIQRTDNPLEGHWGLEERLNVVVQSGDMESKLKCPSPYFRWTTGQHDFLPCLGYSAEGLDEVRITLPGDTTYTIDDIQVYCQPMEGFEKLIDELKAEPLQNEIIGTNTVSGTLSVSQNKILCLSIPYSKGWRAELDGQPQELMAVNTMFMGFAVTEGEHQIALYYETPGLKAGIIASIAGWLIFAGTLIYSRRKRQH